VSFFGYLSLSFLVPSPWSGLFKERVRERFHVRLQKAFSLGAGLLRLRIRTLTLALSHNKMWERG
jgi:hypothetical protein